MEKVKNLQSLIDAKAEKRLNEELSKIDAFVKGNRLLQKTDSSLPFLVIQGSDGKVSESKGRAPYWFFQSGSEYMNLIKEHFLPIFIQEETKIFMDNVERIRDDVDALLDDSNF